MQTWLVKLKQVFPEDDPRNPAVIADNVGDNVGDCAGMAADLFETYVVTIVASMLLAGLFFVGPVQEMMMLYPMALAGVGILSSIVGTFFVRLGSSEDVMGALYKGFFGTAIISAILGLGLTEWMLGLGTELVVDGQTYTGMNLYYCVLIGLAVTSLLIWITEYYTSTKYRPVRSIAQSSTTGHGTNVIQGLAISMEATAMPIIVICVGILLSFLSFGLFGVAIAATTMLALAGMVVALDAYGPVTDNAGGIAEMSELPSEVRNINRCFRCCR